MSSPFWLSYSLLWILVLVESILIFALLREIGRLHLQNPESVVRDGLPIGDHIPAVTVRQNDRDAPLPAFLTAEHVALISALPDCPFCTETVEIAKRWVRANPGRLGATVLLGAPELGKYEEVAQDMNVVLIESRDVVEGLQVRVAPFVHLVDTEGRVLAKGVVNSDGDLRQLLEAADVDVDTPEEVVAGEGSSVDLQSSVQVA